MSDEARDTLSAGLLVTLATAAFFPNVAAIMFGVLTLVWWWFSIGVED